MINCLLGTGSKSSKSPANCGPLAKRDQMSGQGRGGMASVQSIPSRPIFKKMLWYLVLPWIIMGLAAWSPSPLLSFLLLLSGLPPPPGLKKKNNNKVTPNSQTSRSCFSEQPNSERALDSMEYRYATLHPDLACHACT
ncbi:hypothetical protein LZ31DRAFT_88183 [Colletotrichum somersetense]|nr:hypothetical protein LZ31DRAFT_88183 [Colletotrichum somersetense]